MSTMLEESVSRPIKWHGGKSYLADWIISHFPPRVKNGNAPAADDPGWVHYVEPYAGGLAVLLANDPTGISEVVNDINGKLANFWAILKSPYYFRSFQQQVEATPFSRQAWKDAERRLNNGSLGINGYSCWDMAADFFIFCRQSLAGRMKSFAPLTRNRTRQQMNEQASAWLSAIDDLPIVHQRLRRVVILNDDALAVIKKQDGKRTLFYLDPPYLHETRAAPDVYQHEMTLDDHERLLQCLSEIEGRFLLSGYPSQLYDSYAKTRGWQCITKQIDNKASGAKEKKKETECLWKNH